jgi:hypothetical protein
MPSSDHTLARLTFSVVLVSALSVLAVRLPDRLDAPETQTPAGRSHENWPLDPISSGRS